MFFKNCIFFISTILLFSVCKTENAPFVPVLEGEVPDIIGPSGIADSTELSHFIKRYVGHVGEYEIFMLMANWGNGYLHGRHDYTKYSVPLDFYGELKANGEFKLTETRDKKDNAWFEGKFEGPIIKGTWWNVDRSYSMPFEMREHRSMIDILGWTGVWHLDEVWHKGKLIIGDATNNQFDFLLIIDSNNNKGEIYGTAEVLSKNRAVFDLRIIPDLPENCKLVFFRTGDYVKVEQHCFPFLCGFERIAYADGNYYDVLHKKEPELLSGDLKDAPFKSKNDLNIFIDLVGESNYEIFAYTMQKVKAVKVKDQENKITASAYEGALKGLQGHREAIIMQDSSGNIWAATVIVDPEVKEDSGKLHYFTNVENRKNQLPKYIDDWRGRLKDLEVVYESADPGKFVSKE